MTTAGTLIGLLGGLAVATALSVGNAQATSEKTPEQIQQTCEKAEKRYQKYAGKPSADETVHIVKMYQYTFCPSQLTVKQGDTVRWINMDYATSHSVWFEQAGKAESERLFRQEAVEMTFDFPPGDYPYLCGPHWQSDGMTGRVVVTE